MKKAFFSLAVLVFCSQSCITDHAQPIHEPATLKSDPFASNLKAPIGLALDDKGNVWVTEAGTGTDKDDGGVAMITPSGQKTVFVTGLKSIINQGSIEGISKLLYRDGKLYFLHGFTGRLYIADVSSFKSGDAPVSLAGIPSHDIGDFVRKQKYTDPLNSNPFELAFGPDNNLYIADAGGNAIIKRDQTTGDLSEFAVIPKTEEGKDAVPTGIVYDGSKFLVSTLTGFAFTPGAAKIYQITPSGVVSEYNKTKFTTLAGITLSVNNKPIVVQHGTFGAGFTAGTGKVVDETATHYSKGFRSRPTLYARVKKPTICSATRTERSVSLVTNTNRFSCSLTCWSI